MQPKINDSNDSNKILEENDIDIKPIKSVVLNINKISKHVSNFDDLDDNIIEDDE